MMNVLMLLVRVCVTFYLKGNFILYYNFSNFFYFVTTNLIEYQTRFLNSLCSLSASKCRITQPCLNSITATHFFISINVVSIWLDPPQSFMSPAIKPWKNQKRRRKKEWSNPISLVHCPRDPCSRIVVLGLVTVKKIHIYRKMKIWALYPHAH